MTVRLLQYHWIALAFLGLSGCTSGNAVAGQERADIRVQDGTIQVDLHGLPKAISREQLFTWIRTAARAVETYYGRYPVKHVTLDISTEAERHEIHGQEFDGQRVEIGLGPDLTPGDLDADWTLTHEMFHLAFPDMGDKHNWMNEGLSTYLEPIARAAIGTLTPQFVWKETVEGLPQGQPQAGDQGLDVTHTWGRTYWGGCTFWLLADIQVRKETHFHASLQTALRAILDAGGDGSVQWPVSRVIEIGDKATGTHVLRDLYNQMANKPVPIDLDKLWKDLGIIYRNGEVSFDDSASQAAIRKSITSGK